MAPPTPLPPKTPSHATIASSSSTKAPSSSHLGVGKPAARASSTASLSHSDGAAAHHAHHAHPHPPSSAAPKTSSANLRPRSNSGQGAGTAAKPAAAPPARGISGTGLAPKRATVSKSSHALLSSGATSATNLAGAASSTALNSTSPGNSAAAPALSAAARAAAAAAAAITDAGNLRPAWAADVGGDVHTVAFNETGDLVAAGLSTGAVAVFHVQTGERLHVLRVEEAELKVPVTTLGWRPNVAPSAGPVDFDAAPVATTAASAPRTRDVLVAGYPDGVVVAWHAPTGKRVWTFSEGDNQVFALEFSPLSPVLATAGSDCVIRIYDDRDDTLHVTAAGTRKPVQLLHDGAAGASAGHTNRIFCLRWHPKRPELLISGGWDSTIQIWDRRAGLSLRSIFRPHVCGDALDWDESGTKILAGSRARDEGSALNLYAAESGKLLEPVAWSLLDERKQCPLYTARFSPSRRLMVAGGGSGSAAVAAAAAGISSLSVSGNSSGNSGSSGGSSNNNSGNGGNASSNTASMAANAAAVAAAANEVKVFSYATRRCIALVSGLPGAVFAASLTRDDKRLVFGGAFHTLHVYVVDPHSPQEVIY
ncbi:hypothetical protein H9P43_005865 [Blastocladiella emersonii ATCC 22665]|nr:hypothetical protein H9P43_005865 [Blastocladiella emersonii ATCC 22665]